MSINAEKYLTTIGWRVQVLRLKEHFCKALEVKIKGNWHTVRNGGIYQYYYRNGIDILGILYLEGVHRHDIFTSLIDVFA